MARMTVEYAVNCKRCEKPIGYSGMMYEKMKEFGQSRPEYCEECRKILLLEKMTMGAAYFSVATMPGEDLSIAIPGELGMVYHPQRPHKRVEKPATFDASKFGATPNKIVELYKWFKDKDHQVAIVIGDTGSGKSTALPYWLMFPPEGVPDDFFIRDGQILITQPRIVATTSIAEFMGVLLGSSVGKGFDIGYRYSRDRNADRFNACFLATDGTLINLIKSGSLADLSIVMIDEAHERSLNIDIILRLLRDQLPLYPHLKVLIVSATINKELFLNYFGTKTAKIIEFEAKRKFDYEVIFASESERLSYADTRKLKKELVPALVKKVCFVLDEQIAGRKVRGHILAFLHGVKPIEAAVVEIRKYVDANPQLRDAVEVFPLYSDLPPKESDYALKGKDARKIRVVVCTNVAEASVTVEGTVYVVESGIENQARWDIDEEEKSVVLNTISQANAKQRWGRSGRTAPGEVHCLYTKTQFGAMVPFPVPAIQRSSMDDIILLLKDLGIDDIDDGWIQNPVQQELGRSYSSLQKVKAIDADGMLTEYGALLREFAYSASLTDLIVLSDRFGCAVEIATLLPVIKNGGHKFLLVSDPEWDLKTKQRVQKIHEGLWKNCLDDVEFILRLYSIWQNPPSLTKNAGKRLGLEERRKEWAAEFFVNFEVFEEEIDPERTQILQLLSAHKKDKNFREIDFSLIPRARLIISFCVPYEVVGEKYSYGGKNTVAMKIADSDVAVVSEHKAKGWSFLSFARQLIGIEQKPSDVSKRWGADALTSAESFVSDFDGEWHDKVALIYPQGRVCEGIVKSVSTAGAIVTIDGKQDGFVHIGKIGGTHKIENAMTIFKNGQEVYVKVIGYNPERMQLVLSTAIRENNPLIRLSIGQRISGQVVNLTDFGAFVEVGFGYTGLIHVSKFGGRIARPSDMVAVGDMVEAEVLEVKEERGSVRVSLRFVGFG